MGAPLVDYRADVSSVRRFHSAWKAFDALLLP